MTYKQAFLAFCILQFLYFGNIPWHREVMYPHANDIETGNTASDTGGKLINRKFSDQSNQHIPELSLHLHGNYRGWISTWVPNVQLGRPTFQHFGWGKAFIITHFLAYLTGNPFVLYTVQSMITVFLMGLFCFLFLMSLELHPLTCFAGASCISMSVFVSYWITFVYYYAPYCWTLCILWLITVFIRRKSWLTWLGISFAVYNLFITAYIQVIVMLFYLVAAYILYRVWQSSGQPVSKVKTLLLTLSAVALGAAMALPVYLDLAVKAMNSARLQVGDAYFVRVLPPFRTIRDSFLFISQCYDAFLYGNVIDPAYPFVFNGLSITPFYFSLCLLSFTGGLWRRHFFWILLTVIFLIPTLWAPAYLFMVHHLGFHFSRAIPLGGSIIPAYILGAYVLDHFLKHRHGRPVIPVAFILIPLALIIPGAVILGAKHHPVYTAMCVCVAAATCLFAVTGKQALILVLVGFNVLVYGRSIVLTMPLDEIHVSSPLVDRIRKETSDGSRYAKVGKEMTNILPSNQEILFDIRSIHSYDSLSSLNYQKLALSMNTLGTVTYGRHFDYIDSADRIESPEFKYMGVSLLISRDGIDSSACKLLDEINGIKLYRIVSTPVLYAQVQDFILKSDRRVILTGFPDEHTMLNITKPAGYDDCISFLTTAAKQETLLFVSQQYHPFWIASSGNQKLRTVRINDFYLGAIIPAGTASVEFRFRPYAWWCWVPQLFYMITGCVAIIGIIRGSAPLTDLH